MIFAGGSHRFHPAVRFASRALSLGMPRGAREQRCLLWSSESNHQPHHQPQTNEHQGTPTTPDCITGPPEPNSFPLKSGKLEGSVRGPRPLSQVDVSFGETGKACTRKPGRCWLQVGAVHGGRCLKGSCLASPLALGMNKEQLWDCQSQTLHHAGLSLNRPHRGSQPGWFLLCHFLGKTSQLVKSKGARPRSVLGLIFCKVPRERSAPKTICLGILCQFS